ncbi:MAG TPA: proline dehydrogenase family protein [Longimicrobiales bacterium]|nr:proline dehydrogenase family protein [Longimicrobiales bacterium]
MLRDALIYLSDNRLMKRVATSAPGARTMARRFVAGETIDDGVTAARELNRIGMKVTLDYLGESVSNRAEATAAADTYIAMIERIAGGGLDANVSLKLTQMGQDIDRSFLRENVGRVLDLARKHDMFVRLDMESSSHTQPTLDFFRSLWDEGYRNIGIVLQSYMRRSEQDTRDANELGAGVRLCKGAYKEPERVAYQEKREVDDNFVALMRLLLSEGTYPGIATHDEAMIRATTEFVEQNDIARDAFEFQMLYGIRRDVQQRLRDAGYTLRIYVPFGGAWYPYLMRRMAERPANMFFIVNAVLAESPLRFLVRKNRNGR